ncbi:hypothetical protein ABIE88_003379 [Bradyrhizobium diazoefficiens]|uniref:hypothetical protein n=1 Tax=Bradyrhizobium diazoefficiens TaxID=1355477 RepID=UPI0035196F6F
MKVSETQQPTPIVREINPRFRDRLPALMHSVSTIFVAIEPHVQDLEVHLKEFQEYLDFEIEKTKLEISKEAWKNIADRAKLETDSEWLAKLEALRADFKIEAMTAPATLIKSLFKRTREMFGGVSQY